MSIGRAITSATDRKFPGFVILNPGLLITNAISRDVVILEISAGWNLTGPKANQDLDPLTSTPRKMTATNRNSTTVYRSPAPLSHRFGLMRKMMMPPSPNAVSIQMNCLPLLAEKSNMLFTSAPWTDA